MGRPLVNYRWRKKAGYWRAAAAILLSVAVGGCPRVLGACVAAKYELFPKHVGCLQPSQFSTTPRGVGGGDQRTILEDHNAARSVVTAANMQTLTWDTELAALAQRWAESCNDIRDSTVFVPGRFATVGQNVGSGYANWKALVLAWENEGPFFTYGNSSATNYSLVANYAQMLWADASKIGCGFSTCYNIGSFYVCNYAPGRLTPTTFTRPYVNGTHCSVCPNTCNANTKLCDCQGLTCENGATLSLNSCSCTCSSAQYTGPNCGLNCSLSADPEACAAKSANDCLTLPSATQQCPVTCKLCPYAAADYKPELSTTTLPTSSVLKRTSELYLLLLVTSLAVVLAHSRC